MDSSMVEREMKTQSSNYNQRKNNNFMNNEENIKPTLQINPSSSFL